jgi:hypothetical protein
VDGERIYRTDICIGGHRYWTLYRQYLISDNIELFSPISDH